LADDADRLRLELKLSDESNRRRLDKLVDQARELAEDLRRVSHTLHPAILEDLGLVPAIRSLADDFSERTGLPVQLDHFNIPRDLPSGPAIALYRITQEALRNIAKHAGDTAVKVSLQSTQNEIVLTVSDSGHGFDVSNTQAGLGLTSMRERAEQTGGTLSITSAPAKGTSVTARVPIGTGKPFVSRHFN
jgi:two-component system CheB/CheR fusion protein